MSRNCGLCHSSPQSRPGATWLEWECVKTNGLHVANESRFAFSTASGSTYCLQCARLSQCESSKDLLCNIHPVHLGSLQNPTLPTTSAYTYVHACIHTYKHTYKHRYTHTHILVNSLLKMFILCRYTPALTQNRPLLLSVCGVGLHDAIQDGALTSPAGIAFVHCAGGGGRGCWRPAASKLCEGHTLGSHHL